MSSFPRDLVTDILLQLPVKSLVRFQSLSKALYELIKEPCFINKHLKVSIAANRDRALIVLNSNADLSDPPGKECFSVGFNKDDQFDFTAPVKMCQPLEHSRIYGYCNGLVLIFSKIAGCYAIWNPLIRRYKKLPRQPIELPPSLSPSMKYRGCYAVLSFGHDAVNDDYKVVRIVRFEAPRSSGEPDLNDIYDLKIFSLRLHSWKTVHVEWSKESIPAHNSVSVSLNGACHWLLVAPSPIGGIGIDVVVEQPQHSLLAFDLATEKFRDYTIPVLPDRFSDLDLAVLKGCICLYESGRNLKDSNVWVMKEYGVVSSWTLLCTIVKGAVPWSICCRPLTYSKDGKEVLLERDCARLFWYDMEEKRGRKVKFGLMPGVFYVAISGRDFEVYTAICDGSLVLLDGDSVYNFN
ncbi:hypothetical protein SLA2020_273580 [Shorea laevis]